MDDHNLNPPSSNDAVLNVPGPYPCIQQQGKGKQGNIVLAYKSLGVVFGALVTNPLFVYPSMHLSSPTEEDYLGLYSIMFWSLTLISLVKYANIAIKADDHGEGGTFALYSLPCRHLNIGFFSPKQVGLNSPRVTESQTWLAKLLKNSFVARRLLIFLRMMGTCMLVGDGVLTPAISVLAAMDGVRAPFPSFNKRGTFALYSLLCRHLNIGFFSPKQVGLNSPRVTESQTLLAKLFKNSFVARRLLIFLRMMGTCMLVGDGVLTPAISVLAAMDGVRAPFPSFNKRNCSKGKSTMHYPRTNAGV
ncbi:probable potassium transporter 4 [Vicia villosa]|uniref:probable potassium transporter 4 n=1 Tax=Vicia villosa TaxID=3911 RepID=UPI00273C5204|nr:probable potassium transporter 4 [Vicia villosa]